MKSVIPAGTGILLSLLIIALVSLRLPAQNNPPLAVTIYDSASTSGYIFTVPYVLNPPYTYDHPQMILDRYGNTVYYRAFMTGGIATTTADFKLQPNGLMSFYSPAMGKFYLMDSTFTVIDSVTAGNGYDTDTHELQVLPDGHYLVLGRETQFMNLTSYHWFGPSHTLPGSPHAEVTGSVVQELDENKNVVFQWRAHANFTFGDVDSVWLNSPASVDWTHSNALELDDDGNILLSSRHLNEVTKINRSNGSIMWRMGGKNNQYTFIGDALGYTGQHDIRRLANGNVTLWDNGQFTDPPLGRALEYTLDEGAKTATLKWGYVQDSGMFSYAMGNHQRLPGNKRFLTYGFITPPYPMMAMVNYDSTKIMEISGPPGYGCYRAFHYDSLPFTIDRPAVHCETNGDTWYLVAEPGHAEYLWSNGATTQSVAVTITGPYQVFTPYGNGGHVGSEIIRVADINDPCGSPLVPVNRSVGGVTVEPGHTVCYDATGSITAGGAGGSFTIHSGGSSALVAGVKILLEPGVTVLSGGHLHGFVTQSGQYCQARSALKSGDTGAEGLSHGMPAYPGESSHVYPNPTTGYFTLEPAGVFRNMKLHAEIWSIHGQKVLSRDLAGSGSYGFSLGDTPCGLYILKIKGDKTAESIRLLKQD